MRTTSQTGLKEERSYESVFDQLLASNFAKIRSNAGVCADARDTKRATPDTICIAERILSKGKRKRVCNRKEREVCASGEETKDGRRRICK